MKIRTWVLITVTSIIVLLLIYSYKHLCYYAEVKYGPNTEHIDVRVSGLKFEVLHYILDKDSHLILSEEMSGVSLRKPWGICILPIALISIGTQWATERIAKVIRITFISLYL